MHTEIIFQHGWAFDANCWNQWRQGLVDTADNLMLGERGYYGAAKQAPSFTASATKKIAIAHSFGAHLLSKQILSACDTLVIINGFVSLKRNARAIRLMLKKFPSAPDQVICDFWASCYWPHSDSMSLLPPPGMNEALLEADLEAMLTSELDLELVKTIPNIVLVHSEHDRIVTPETSKELTDALPNANVVNLAEAGHAAVLAQADKCTQIVEHWVTGNQLARCRTQK